MARPKESNEQKVKKVYPDASIIQSLLSYEFKIWDTFSSIDKCNVIGRGHNENLAWQDALTQIRKAKIKAAKDKRKQANPVKVKEIKKHVGLTMYPSDKAIIVKGFGSVQKFLDIAIREYRSK